MVFKIFFPTLFVVGVYCLYKSISRILQIFDGHKTEFAVTPANVTIDIPKPGTYEIAFIRASMWGIMPTNIPFRLVNQADHAEIAVVARVNHLGSRKDLRGRRIVPIAEFEAEKSGNYIITVPEIPRIKKGDSLMVTAKTGSAGFLMIIPILFSGALTIATLVLSVLAWLGKL